MTDTVQLNPQTILIYLTPSGKLTLPTPLVRFLDNGTLSGALVARLAGDEPWKLSYEGGMSSVKQAIPTSTGSASSVSIANPVLPGQVTLNVLMYTQDEDMFIELLNTRTLCLQYDITCQSIQTGSNATLWKARGASIETMGDKILNVKDASALIREVVFNVPSILELPRT
jgi:hypothetical protein